MKWRWAKLLGVILLATMIVAEEVNNIFCKR